MSVIKNPLIRILFVIVIYSTQLFSGTTGSLEGYVTDSQSGESLVGVNVVILETKQGSATNLKGFYKIHNIRAGSYQVKISMIGYRTVTYKNITIHPDRRTKLNVELLESPIEMAAIEVRAERPIIQTDVTGTAYDISSQEITELPIDKFQEVIGLQAGTTIEGNVRGGKVREVIYLIDGLPVQDVIRGGLGTDLPKSAILQMSVKTGGFDAEYGNALSGVVNVITRTGGDDHHIYLRADKDDLFGGTQVSKHNDIEFAADGPIASEKLHYFFANNLFLTDTRWWQDMQHFFDSPIRKQLNGLAKIDWLFSPAKRLSSQLIYSLERWRDYEFSWRYNLDGLPARRRGSYRAALFWTHTLSKKTFYSISLSQYYLNSKIGSGKPGNLTTQPYQYDFFLLYIISGDRIWWANMNQHTYSLKTEFTSQIHPSHLLKAGIEFDQYNIDSNLRKMEPQTTYFGKPLVYEPLLNFSSKYQYYPRSGSVYIQDKIEAGKDKSLITLGLRFDFLDPRASRPAVELIPVGQGEYQEQVTEYVPAKIKHYFSPRIGFAFPLTDKSFFFVNYGHYFQYPLFEYLYSGLDNVNIRHGVNVLRGNPNLLAERTWAWEVSARYNFAENMVASLAYFKKETYDQIDTKTFVPSNSRIAGDYGFAEYVNNPYAIATGYELVITREKGKWIRGNFSYTLMKAKGLSNYENQGLNYAQWGFPVARSPFYLSWDQRHTFKADITFDLPMSILANVMWHHHSGRPYTYYPSKDGFTPDNPDKKFLPNNRRMSSNDFLDLKVSKEFQLGKLLNAAQPSRYNIAFYIEIRNLLNVKNVRWMDSSGRIGGELYDPAAYYIGRRTAVGIRAEF